MLLAIAVTIGYDLYFDYQNIRLEAKSHLTYQAQIVKDSLSRQLQATSNAIDAIREDVSERIIQPAGVKHISRQLKILAASMTGLRTLVVVNSDGEVIASNRAELIGQEFRDSERYKTIRTAENPNILHISRAYISPLNVRVISVGKMIPNANGKFNGYVLAILDPAHFETLMRSVLYTKDMSATLIHGDGEVILRLPDPDGLTGKDLSQHPNSLFTQFVNTGEQALFLDSASSVTRKELLGQMIQVRPDSSQVDKPLVFSALLDKKALYAPWRNELALRVVLFLGFAAISVLLLTLYQRRQRAFAELAAEKLAEHRMADAEIKTMAERLSLALDGAGMGAYHWDLPTGKITWTDTYRRVMRIDSSIEPSYEFWFASLHPDDQEAAKTAVCHALAEMRDLNIQYRTVTADGSIRWIASQGRFFCDDDGRVGHMEGVVTDITDRKHAESLLAERAQQVELLNIQLEKRAVDAEVATRAKDAFMRTISHELRTPLNHIMAAGDIVSRGAMDPKQRHWLTIMHNASSDLMRMVSEILDLTHIAAGRMKLENAAFSPSQLLEEVRLMLSLRAEAKQLPIVLSVAPEVPEFLFGAPVRVSQALYNLLDNAIKFTESGEISLSTKLLSKSADGLLIRFEVSDTGIGISADELKELLSESQRFRQLDDKVARNYGGLGLGLANVRELAKLMGGQIGGESEPNKGSRFWITARFQSGHECATNSEFS
ncbi:MAG: multi-sensor hybrid histidine kinase [Proteobacteria bacterium]|nr:multi-sensor hybrid histidine kinase [Pseudomonadota bacterium]